jgi:hypothetical protein
MAKKTGRVTRNRKRSTPRDLRPATTTVKGGAVQAFFAGGVLSAYDDGAVRKLAK